VFCQLEFDSSLSWQQKPKLELFPADVHLFSLVKSLTLSGEPKMWPFSCSLEPCSKHH